MRATKSAFHRTRLHSGHVDTAWNSEYPQKARNLLRINNAPRCVLLVAFLSLRDLTRGYSNNIRGNRATSFRKFHYNIIPWYYITEACFQWQNQCSQIVREKNARIFSRLSGVFLNTGCVEIWSIFVPRPRGIIWKTRCSKCRDTSEKRDRLRVFKTNGKKWHDWFVLSPTAISGSSIRRGLWATWSFQGNRDVSRSIRREITNPGYVSFCSGAFFFFLEEIQNALPRNTRHCLLILHAFIRLLETLSARSLKAKLFTRKPGTNFLPFFVGKIHSQRYFSTSRGFSCSFCGRSSGWKLKNQFLWSKVSAKFRQRCACELESRTWSLIRVSSSIFPTRNAIFTVKKCTTKRNTFFLYSFNQQNFSICLDRKTGFRFVQDQFIKTPGTWIPATNICLFPGAIDSSEHRFAIYLHRTICFELQTGSPVNHV